MLSKQPELNDKHYNIEERLCEINIIIIAIIKVIQRDEAIL